MLNQYFLDEPVILDIDRLPVFPVYGERVWIDDQVIWQGIVRKGKPIQKLINYGFSQLCERMAQAPKNAFIAEAEAIEGYIEGYRNFNKNNNPILLYNRWSDDHKIEYNAPTRIDNKVQFDDLTQIIGSNLELLSTITGVDAKGIMQGETTEKTATEVLAGERQTQCTIRHFYANLRDTFKSVGETVIQLLGMGKVVLDVIQGPENSIQLQVARQELMSLMQIVPEDKRMSFVNGIFMTHPDNAVLKNVFGAINMNPGPSPLEQQAFATIEEMKAAIQDKNVQIQELQDQLKQWKSYDENNERELHADFAKSAMEHKFKQEDMILQAQLNNGLDIDKAAMDNQKAQMELERQAIQLDAARVKAGADMAKSIMSLGGKNENQL